MVHIDGRIFTGMLVHENEGKTILGDNEGKTIELKTAEIEERRPVKTSVMPEKLVDRMTVQEWRDLLSFLQSCK
jgi:putative heme-binding domain-containing protein